MSVAAVGDGVAATVAVVAAVFGKSLVVSQLKMLTKKMNQQWHGGTSAAEEGASAVVAAVVVAVAVGDESFVGLP